MTFVGLRMAQHATTIMTMNDKKKDEDGECLIFELIPTCTDHFTNFKCRSRCTMAQWNQVYHKMPNTNQTSAKSAATRSSCQSGKEIFLSTRATVRSELQFSRKGEEGALEISIHCRTQPHAGYFWGQNVSSSSREV